MAGTKLAGERDTECHTRGGIYVRPSRIREGFTIARAYGATEEALDLRSIDVDYVAVECGRWDADHVRTLEDAIGDHDVAYSRWRTKDGVEWPFSPYNEAALLGGLDFIGTDVLVRVGAIRFALDPDEPWPGLFEAFTAIARAGGSFVAVNAVTYTKE